MHTCHAHMPCKHIVTLVHIYRQTDIDGSWAAIAAKNQNLQVWWCGGGGSGCMIVLLNYPCL